MTMAENAAASGAPIMHLAESERCEVFVSHRSGSDATFAEALTHAIRERGIDCFLDLECIESGVSFAERILEGIKRSQVVVVLFGDDISSWVHFEASCAYFEKKLIPVSLNGAEVPLPYGRLEYYKVHSDPQSGTVDTINQLVDAVQYKLDVQKSTCAGHASIDHSTTFASAVSR